MINQIRWHDREVRRKVIDHCVKNLTAATIHVQTAARRNVKPGGRSGFKTSRGAAGLSGSIGYEINARNLRSRIGSSLRYARIQEQGGTITPKSASKLAVPVTDEARRARGPRSMSDLELIPRQGRPSLLARIDENFDLDVQFVLLDSVTLPPRPYLRPAVYNERDRINKLLLKPMPKGA